MKPSLITRAHETIDRYDIPTQPVLPHITPKYMSFQIADVSQVEFDMVAFRKNEVPESVIRGAFRQLINEKYSECQVIYTDGSKSDTGVGAAVVTTGLKRSASLPITASIYTAELKAIQIALQMIEESEMGNFLICSDSMSALQGIGNFQTDGMVYRIKVYIHERKNDGKNVLFLWTSSHVGIEGNEEADAEAKRAATRPAEFIPIPYRDWYPTIRYKTNDLWGQRWRQGSRSLNEVVTEPTKWNKIRNITRKLEVIISRLRLGHSRMSHEYLIKDHPCPPPICQ